MTGRVDITAYALLAATVALHPIFGAFVVVLCGLASLAMGRQVALMLVVLSCICGLAGLRVDAAGPALVVAEHRR